MSLESITYWWLICDHCGAKLNKKDSSTYQLFKTARTRGWYVGSDDDKAYFCPRCVKKNGIKLSSFPMTSGTQVNE